MPKVARLCHLLTLDGANLAGKKFRLPLPYLKQKEKRPRQGPRLGFAMCKWRFMDLEITEESLMCD